MESLLGKTDDLEPILDFIFSSDMLKKLETQSYCDLAGLLSIHCVLSTSGGLQEKLLQQEFLVNAFGFLESANLVVKE